MPNPLATIEQPGRDQGALREFILSFSPLFVLTGAGCSTESGIPDYRDAAGDWKRPPPVTYQAFRADSLVRQRYWARSLIGWPRIAAARANGAHLALEHLERCGRVASLVTQNVDGLHRAAGSRNVIDLHGRLDQIVCLRCDHRTARQHLQQQLLEHNPDWAARVAPTAPDGDADLGGVDFSAFAVPACTLCGGLLKPDVVFFGESVPPQRVTSAMKALERAKAVLVVGSSLMVYSGYRFVRHAAQAGMPIAAVNLGRTRADELLTLKIEQPASEALAFLLDGIGGRGSDRDRLRSAGA